MDKYSMSGPKTPKGIRSTAEREMQARMKRLLAVGTDGEFIRQLQIEAGVDPKHPNYLRMIKLGRDLHP